MSDPLIDAILPILCQRTAAYVQAETEALAAVKWQKGEANTDIGFSYLVRRCCRNVLCELPTPGVEIKVIDLRTKGDLLLEFTINGTVHERKIELKSGKTTVIPGSCCSKLDLNEWVIWCLRKNGFHIRYGQYYDSILKLNDPKLIRTPFDRSSRPKVHFDRLQAPTTSPKPSIRPSPSAAEWSSIGARNSVKHWVNTGCSGTTWSHMWLNSAALEMASLIEEEANLGNAGLQRIIESRRQARTKLDNYKHRMAKLERSNCVYKCRQWLQKHGPVNNRDFVRKVAKYARKLGLKPDDMAGCIDRSAVYTDKGWVVSEY